MKPRRIDVEKTNKQPPRKLRILITNVAEPERRAVRHLLSSQGWEICGEATDGVEAVEKAEALKPDIVIVDLATPGLNGLDVTRRILERNPLQRVLVLAAHGSAKAVRDCRRAGARGFLSKSNPAADLSLAVRALAADQTFFTARAVAMTKKPAKAAS
jgi:DNA-binding NarL/FixJ family response regulator